MGMSLLLLSSVGSSFAQGRIEERKENQQGRIAEGVRNGSLTPAEAARLERKERKVNREVRRDRRDGGGLSPAERAKIEKDQDRLSRDIAKQKHDRQTQ
jgi:hypothetical protein